MVHVKLYDMDRQLRVPVPGVLAMFTKTLPCSQRHMCRLFTMTAWLEADVLD